jgi:hypothetical protein
MELKPQGPPKGGQRGPRPAMTADIVKKATEWRQDGYSYKQIAETLGINMTTVYRALKGVTIQEEQN